MQKFFKLWYFIATGFGLGNMSYSYCVPIGTLGSMVAIPIWWILIYFFSYKIFLIFLIFGIVIGIYTCDKINKIIGIHDHRSIIWDEFLGMWITLIVVPIYNGLWISIAFLLFRMFDIIKPWPIEWADRVIKGGLGIIIDDILAGLVSMFIIIWLINIFY